MQLLKYITGRMAVQTRAYGNMAYIMKIFAIIDIKSRPDTLYRLRLFQYLEQMKPFVN